MSEHTFRPQNGVEADTLVISYYPLVGNDDNTGPRYALEADITGYDVLGITRVGSDTLHRDRELRKALSPELFDESWQEHAANLNDQAKNYDYVIVRGQSAGSFPGLSVVKNGLVRATHMVIEDGVNLRTNRHGLPKASLLNKLDWLKDMVDHARLKPEPFDPTWVKPAVPPTGLKKFATEVYHWTPLWESAYSRDSALEIATDHTELPMLFVFLGHTATGNNKQVMAFVRMLKEAEEARKQQSDSAAAVKSLLYLDAWHDVLEFPEFGASHLQYVRAMPQRAKK